MKNRTLILGLLIAAASAVTLVATNAAAQPTPPPRPTFGAMPEGAMRALQDAAKHAPGLLTAQARTRMASQAQDVKTRFRVPDYIGVIGDGDEVVGYTSSERVLNPLSDIPANPAEAVARMAEPPPLEEVVDQNLNVIGHLGPKGFVPLGD